MPTATIRTRTIRLAKSIGVTVTATLTNRLPSAVVVGVCSGQARELAERVRCAIRAAGCDYPASRVVLDIVADDGEPVRGCDCDLAAALAVLAASGQVKTVSALDTAFIGELSLSGDVRPVRGAICHALSAKLCGQPIVVPAANLPEAAEAGAIVHGVPHLSRAVAHLEGTEPGIPATQPGTSKPARPAALWGLLFIGSGGIKAARDAYASQPPISRGQAFSVACVQSAAGLTQPGSYQLPGRPFRAPHHTISVAGMVGRQSAIPTLGEVDLARCGVLLLDEVAEFRSAVLDTLRSVMARDVGDEPLIVATANVCPCGNPASCACTSKAIERYQARVQAVADLLHLEVRDLGA